MARISIFVAFTIGLLCAGAALSGAQDLDQARRAALQRLEQSLGRGAVAGRFVERTPGSYVFVPDSRGLPAVPVLNPDDLAAGAGGPRLEVRATYDAAAEGVRVSDYGLSL